MKGICKFCVNNKYFSRLDRHLKKMHFTTTREKMDKSPESICPLNDSNVIGLPLDFQPSAELIPECKSDSLQMGKGGSGEENSFEEELFKSTSKCTSLSQPSESYPKTTLKKQDLALQPWLTCTESSLEKYKKELFSKENKDTKKPAPDKNFQDIFWKESHKKPVDLAKYLTSLPPSGFKEWIKKCTKTIDGVPICMILQMLFWICYANKDKNAPVKKIKKYLTGGNKTIKKNITKQVKALIFKEFAPMVIRNHRFMQKILRAFVKFNKKNKKADKIGN